MGVISRSSPPFSVPIPSPMGLSGGICMGLITEYPWRCGFMLDTPSRDQLRLISSY